MSWTSLKPIRSIGTRTGVIYSWLFEFTQQHTAGFTENNWATHPLWPKEKGQKENNNLLNTTQKRKD